MIKNYLALALMAGLQGVPTCTASSDADGGGFQGTLELEERALPFELTGRVVAIAVTEGQRVQGGDELARLDATLERLTLAGRQADLQAAQAELALLEAGSRVEDIRAIKAELSGAVATEKNNRRMWERLQALVVRGAASVAELDDAQASFERSIAQRRDLESRLARLRHGARPQELEAARARVEAQRAALRLVEERIDRHVLHAGAAGTVLNVHLEPSELAMVGAPVVTLADTTRPYVDVFVPQQRIGEVQLGAPAHVRVDAETELFSGTVEFVGAQVEFTPRFLFSPRERPNLVLRVRVRIDDPSARLHAGVPAFVTFAGESLS